MEITLNANNIYLSRSHHCILHHLPTGKHQTWKVSRILPLLLPRKQMKTINESVTIIEFELRKRDKANRHNSRPALAWAVQSVSGGSFMGGIKVVGYWTSNWNNRLPIHLFSFPRSETEVTRLTFACLLPPSNIVTNWNQPPISSQNLSKISFLCLKPGSFIVTYS